MRFTQEPAVAFGLLLLLSNARADDIACSTDNPCKEGCCSEVSRVCGYGPSYCGTSCIAEASLNGTCSHMAECDPGVYPGWGESWGSNYSSLESCPLNVCCSEFGFCGTTSDFCGDTTWESPSCSNGASANERRIGYYEAFNLDHSCNVMTPEEIPVGAYTHLIFSFLYIDPQTYEITPMESNQTDLYSRFAALKDYGVEAWISIGGWAMNDPGKYSTVFSDLAASSTAQDLFFTSLKSFMEKYGFDGVDIDWEYPGAPDRYGTDDDYENFVTFLNNLRSSLGSEYGLSTTLPSSYWYLQYFDVSNLAKVVDWFNFMSYDIYGTWDSTIESIGNAVYASTNLTMIDSGLKLLWHNGIEPSQVNLGLGYYGRSYTLKDSTCTDPGCQFTAGGNPGPCSQTEGLLSYDEILDIIDDPSRNPTVWLDSAAAVKIAVYDGDQWVAYDDSETIQLKMDFANSLCMGGVMAWAVDEDLKGDLSEAISGAGNLFPAGGSGELYVSPEIWNSDVPEVSCQSPCTLILPPFPLPTPSTVSWPALTTSLMVSTNGGVSTTTTTIPVPAFQMTDIPFWPVTVASEPSGVLMPVQSIAPPSMVVTLPGSITPFPISHTNYTQIAMHGLTSSHDSQSGPSGTITKPATLAPTAVTTPTPYPANMASGCTDFYQVQSGDSCWSIETSHDIDAAVFEDWNPDVGTDCSGGVWLNYYYCVGHSQSSSTATGIVSSSVTGNFGTTSHIITIQPQATHTTIQPPSDIPPIAVHEGKPENASSNDEDCDGCGSLDCTEFGCDGKCGRYGCDGGCGLRWCGGGCGLRYCGPGCGDGSCIVEGGGGGTGATGLNQNNPEDAADDCSSMVAASICTEFVRSFSTTGMASSSTTTTTECGITEGCSVTPSTTTTTISTTESISTFTNSFMYIARAVEPTSVQSSISSSISSQRDAWDATRWSGVTPTSTSTQTLSTPTITPNGVYHIYFNVSLVQQYGEGIYVNRGASFDNCSFVADWKDLHGDQIIKSLMPDSLTNVKVKDAVCDYASTLDESLDLQQPGTIGQKLGILSCDIYTNATCYLPDSTWWACENTPGAHTDTQMTAMAVCDWDSDNTP